ncbi:MAG: hypothetical protein NTW86_09810, partial [Candidatus Sumerlaeota bacterium]|nr:hypothetical protein [Candidatus Sumerlaeota bacterium]
MTGSQNKQVLAPSPAGLSDRNLDRELDAWINTMHSRLDHLQDAVNSLPIVDAEGNSDCPFATKLYAQKDEELQRVVFSVGLAQGYLARVDSELER